MIKHIGSFVATDDKGKQYTIDMFQNFIDSRHGGPLPSTKTMECDGNHVNRIDKGRYEMLGFFGNTMLNSDDPDAP